METMPFDHFLQSIVQSMSDCQNMADQKSALAQDDQDLSLAKRLLPQQFDLDEMVVNFQAHLTGISPKERAKSVPIGIALKGSRFYKSRNNVNVEIRLKGTNPPTGDVHLNGRLFKRIPPSS